MAVSHAEKVNWLGASSCRQDNVGDLVAACTEWSVGAEAEDTSGVGELAAVLRENSADSVHIKLVIIYGINFKACSGHGILGIQFEQGCSFLAHKHHTHLADRLLQHYNNIVETEMELEKLTQQLYLCCGWKILLQV